MALLSRLSGAPTAVTGALQPLVLSYPDLGRPTDTQGAPCQLALGCKVRSKSLEL